MPEHRVVIEIDLRIQREQPAIRTGDKWIDFHQRGISILKRAIQTSHKPHCFTNLLRLQPKGKRQLARLKSFQAHAGIDVLFKIASGFSAATCSISIPPAADAINTGLASARSITIPR